MGFFKQAIDMARPSNSINRSASMFGLGPETKEVDAGPGADELRGQMQKQNAYAKELQANQPGLMERQASIQRGQGRGALAGAMAGNRQNFNSRGLLFSGLRKGAESGLQAQGASNLAGGISESNRGVMDQTNAARQAAIGTGQQVANLDQQRESNRVEALMQALGKRSEAMGSAGRGLGSMAGMMAGGMK